MNKAVEKDLIFRANINPPAGGSRHAAAIVCKNRIISIGTNKLKSHPMMAEFSGHPEKIWLHAEIDAIIKAINIVGVDFLKNCDLKVVRLDIYDRLALSKPCEICRKAIEHFNIKSVEWSE